jgi:hypothetical protein
MIRRVVAAVLLGLFVAAGAVAPATYYDMGPVKHTVKNTATYHDIHPTPATVHDI